MFISKSSLELPAKLNQIGMDNLFHINLEILGESL